MKFFWLKRNEDVSGTSGVGIVAEGVIFSNGCCSLHWLSKYSTVTYFQSMDDLKAIHEHNGATEIVFEVKAGVINEPR